MSDTRLRLILELRDKVLAPLRGIQSGGKDAAAALKATRDQLRGLEKAQQDIDVLRKTRVQLRGQQRDLQDLQGKLAGSNASLVEHRERHKNIAASLKTARESHSKLTKALQDGATATPELSRQLEMARIRLLSSQTAYERSNSTLSKYRTQIKTAEAGIAQLSSKIDNGKDRLIGFQQRLERVGISTERLGQQSRNYKTQIEAATAAMDRQKQALAQLKVQQERMAALKANHGKAMMHTGMAVGAGVGLVAEGRAIAKPVQATLGAFSKQEDATTQLSASMMQSDGSVSAEFTQIDALAKRLGDRLPGTTADFIEMMTMLRRQGLSAQSILGGTGEAAALLGVQLRMPVTAAAEFAAKMQDATRTTEKDMLGLMDMIQRTFYLGVDSGNMLQGFTKMSPIMNVIRKDGLEASKMLAPLLVMMDQTGMKGEAAGNAFRKIFQSAMNTDKIKKVTDGLKIEKGISLKLDFTNGKGEFGSIEQMYKELSKLNGLTTEKRLSVIKDLFGDDSETMQALDTMISKGKAGYDEVVAKMEAQADLQKRVDQQLATLTNVLDSAQGGFTNVMAAVGDTIKDDAKDIIKAVGDITSSVGGWIKEHPALTAGIARTLAVLAGLMVVLGTLLVPLALIAGKFLLMRFLFRMMGMQTLGFTTALRGLSSVLSGSLGSAFRGMGGAAGIFMRLRASFTTASGALGLLRGTAAGALRLLTLPLRAFPITAALLGFGTVIYNVAQRWEEFKGYFNAGQWGSLFAGIWQTAESGLNAVTFGMYGLLRNAVLSIGGTLKDLFLSAINTMVEGARAAWAALGGSFPAVLQNIGAAIMNWSPLALFYQAFAGVMSYFGVALPTKFSEFGANIIQGLVNGITSKLAMVREAVGGAADSAIGWFKEKLGIHSPSRVFLAAGVNVGEGAAIGIDRTVGMVRQSAAAMAMAAGVSLAAPVIAAPQWEQATPPAISQELPRAPRPLPAILPPITQPEMAQAQPMLQQPMALQATVAQVAPVAPQLVPLQPIAPQVPPLPRQPMPLQPVLPQALPALTQPVEPLLQQLQPMLQQRMPVQPVLAQALPAITQQLAPVLQQLPPVARQAMPLRPVLEQALPAVTQPLLPALQQLPPMAQQAMPIQANPVQIDRRPVLAGPAPAAARPAPVIHGDTITIQIHAAPGMDLQAIGREVERVIEQRERAKAARLQSSFTDWN
ncbi:phage tail tape measure protein [Comamonas testosteroni]|uniref:Phage tail tape measure protein, TP901 family n=1 Tax=Comamonas testosteroni (strain DSM 14576 / KF-1) TaxID=399795 RepID=B7WUH4_COMTK|nr:phage tail tape measure protein [Comamonas testosteroni]EED65658.1 phage tail tape measure protein, TP901 family [Comamonas testosteroni KF-1]WQG69059.1 phage tail tape measure protein [Comamonas testosteroni]